jgi:hypothetical protein
LESETREKKPMAITTAGRIRQSSLQI